VISAVPLSIRQRLHRKLDAEAGDVGIRLNRLQQKTSLTMDDFDDTLIGDLRTVVAALDDEVTTIYSRMRRFR
jgi:hypothetical protein